MLAGPWTLRGRVPMRGNEKPPKSLPALTLQGFWVAVIVLMEAGKVRHVETKSRWPWKYKRAVRGITEAGEPAHARSL